MKFEDAIKLSIKEFSRGKYPKKLDELKDEGLLFTPEWFDAFEESLDEATGKKSAKTKSKRKAPEDESPEYDGTETFGLGGLGYAGK